MEFVTAQELEAMTRALTFQQMEESPTKRCITHHLPRPLSQSRNKYLATMT